MMRITRSIILDTASAAEANSLFPAFQDYYCGVTARASKAPLTIFTIGHSTRPIDEFIDLLRANAVKQLADIRTIPKSRHNPPFNSDALAASLRAAHIRYVHLQELGGLRHAKLDSINLGWRNASFRGYADYMQTPEFARALERAIHLAESSPTALMCAEAVPWRCHRSLVADALLVRGIRVEEIIGPAKPKEHKLTPFAFVRGARITYPSDQSSLLAPH
jgi:uncharacterized protein (DUF488 family)